MDRYQIHLVAYNKTSQKWQLVDEEEEAFLTVPDLMAEHPVASSGTDIEEVDSDIEEAGPDKPAGTWTPAAQDRQSRDSSSQRQDQASSSSQSQSESSSESSSANNPETLKRLKERLNKRQAKNSNHKSKSKHQAPSHQSKKESKASANSNQG